MSEAAEGKNYLVDVILEWHLVLFFEGELQKAIDCYTQAVIKNPTSALLYSKRARYLSVIDDLAWNNPCLLWSTAYTFVLRNQMLLSETVTELFLSIQTQLRDTSLEA